ncbi:hypothetical protein ACAG26_08870 [Mycobacterium sp. pUA109]|uniref:channel accessory protein ArfB n=1 Tax=Mycobacterium sp. pUA109 TaxID=3238982 RepID=UPI00351B08BF
MDFVVQWLWCLLAFAAGSLVAWGIAIVSVKHTSKDEALAGLPDAREIGAR